MNIPPDRFLCRHSVPRHGGFSLIEMMITIVISLILMIGLVQVITAGKRAYQAMQGANFMQENARFAMSQITHSIQMADHWGPNNPDQAKSTTAAVTALTGLYGTCKANYITDTSNPFYWALGIYGIDGTAGPDTVLGSGCLPDYVAGTDVVVLRYADSTALPCTGGAACNTAVSCGAINCIKPSTIIAPYTPATSLFVRVGVAHQMILATGADINTQISNIATGVYTLPFDQGFMVSPNPAQVYNQDGLYTFPFRMEIYYVRKCSNPSTSGNCTASSDNGQPIPTLWRRYLNDDGNWALEAAVEGIEALHLEYGIATCGGCGQNAIPAVFSDILSYGSAANLSATASNNLWYSVVSVRIGLAAQGDVQGNYGRTDVSQRSVQQPWYLGSDTNSTYTPNAPLLQHTVYTTIAQLRNRSRG